MIPKKIINFIPDSLSENLDKNGLALIEFLDEFNLNILNDILSIWYNKYPEKAKEIILDSLGKYLEAEIKSNDSIKQKRIKIVNAVKRHKLRGTWENDIKIRIDSITGKSSSLVKNTTVFESDDSILISDNNIDNDFYNTLGTDGTNEFGIYLPEVINVINITPGIIVIDIGIADDDVFIIQNDDFILVSDNNIDNDFYNTLGTDGTNEFGIYLPGGEINSDVNILINKIKQELLDSVPAYFVIYLGYTNDDGNFISLGVI